MCRVNCKIILSAGQILEQAKVAQTFHAASCVDWQFSLMSCVDNVILKRQVRVDSCKPNNLLIYFKQLFLAFDNRYQSCIKVANPFKMGWLDLLVKFISKRGVRQLPNYHHVCNLMKTT